MSGRIGETQDVATVTVRCNAPQRSPRYPDTTWGRAREARGWSLRELSERTGINAGELSKIERGRQCATFAQASLITDAFEDVP